MWPLFEKYQMGTSLILQKSLTVTIDTDIHTAVWTNNSQEVPAELVEITNEIKNKAHEKK